MKVSIQTRFHCSSQTMFYAVKQTEYFFIITAPLVRFIPINPLEEEWVKGEHLMKMYLFGWIPMGEHTILIEYDEAQKMMRDNGRGQWIRKWDHMITLRDDGEKQCIYKDEIEIEAGFMTFFVFLFAHVFYRYRQLRWKKLIKSIELR